MILTLIVFLFVLSILVFVHELGHFIVAKRLGIKVEEFGFGLPPRLWGIKKGETIYSINWLPIGGFVRLYGEEGPANENPKSEIRNPKSEKDSSRAFYSRPVWQRATVVTAGVAMNFLLAFVIVTYLFTQGVMVPTDRVHVEKVVEDSPAHQADIQVGDVIKSFKINEEQIVITNGEDLINTIKEHLGEQVILVLLRNNIEFEVKLTPRKDYPSDQGPTGIVISNFEQKRFPITQAPFIGMKVSLQRCWELTRGIGQTLYKLVTFQPVGQDVAGPVGIAVMTGEAVRLGRLALLEWISLLSLNLAIINILPIPALDGGRLLFIIIETVSGRTIH